MGKPKFRMPSAEFLLRHRIGRPNKSPPVWVFLEKEMREKDKAQIKPYNHKVGEWLVFLKDLKKFYRSELKRKYKSMVDASGPPWFNQLSCRQQDELKNLKECIHEDLLEDIPIRTRASLRKLGLTIPLPDKRLMSAMSASAEDPGVFMWTLFTDYYKHPPYVAKDKYDYNCKLIMSSLVFIDYDECLYELNKIMEMEPEPPPKPPKKPKKYFEPKVRYGEYLSKMYAPLFEPESGKPKKKKVLTPLKIRLRPKTEESHTRIREDVSFLKKRRDRNIKAQLATRKCHYKFWEPPASCRTKDPEMLRIIKGQKMFKRRAKPTFLKHKPPFDNLQCHLGTVTYAGGKPVFVINSMTVLPTGYIPINGGLCTSEGKYITNVHGMLKLPTDNKDSCDAECNCLQEWEAAVMKYITQFKCKCRHWYDYKNEGKVLERYFFKPTKHSPHWFDFPKIYQLDPTEEYIKKCVEEALRSKTATPEPEAPDFNVQALSPKVLLKALLTEVGKTALIIPHLPDANLLASLQEFVCKKVKKPLTKKQHRSILVQSQKRWGYLSSLHFRGKATLLGFTPEELKNFSYAHRKLLQTLYERLKNNFVRKNNLKQIDHTRLFWATLRNEIYAGKSFEECYFSYFPAKLGDLFCLNPYSAADVPKNVAKTCPIYYIQNLK